MAKSDLIKTDKYIEIKNTPIKYENGSIQYFDISLSLNSRDVLLSGDNVIIHAQNGSSITFNYKDTTISGADATSSEQLYEWFQNSAFALSGGGGGGTTTVTWADIQDKPATFPPSPHTHLANEITYGDSNVGTVLGTTMKDGDSGKTLNYLTVDGITLKNSFTYESANTDPKTKIYLSNSQTGINATAEAGVVNVTNGEFMFMGSANSSFTMSLPLNLRKDINFQGGAITNMLLWKNGAGQIRPIFNHPDATDGPLTLPKMAGTLALVEDLPTNVAFDKITGITEGNLVFGGATGNQQRKIKPTDIGLGKNYLLVTLDSDTWGQLPYRTVPNNNSVAQRTSTGTLKATTAVADDDLTTFLQVKDLTDTTAINGKIKTYLLALPNATAGNILKINSTGDDFEWVTP